MSYFYIKELNIYSPTKETVTIKFTENLNLIIGESELGKTLIVRCITFLLGEEGKGPILEKHGYTSCELVVATKDGEIRIKRDMHANKNKATITSSDSLIESGTYSVKRDSKNPNKKSMPQIWLTLLGLNKNQKVVKNESYQTVHSGLRTIMPLLYLDEDNVTNKDTILLPEGYQTRTPFFSTLLLLLYDIDMSNLEEAESNEMKKEKRKAVLKFVAKKIKDTEKRINDIEATIGSENWSNDSINVDELTKMLEEYTNKINKNIQESETLYNEIISIQQNLAEYQFSLKQLRELKSQYKADRERLSTTITGSNTMNGLKKNPSCPYCDNPLPQSKLISFKNAEKKELEKIQQAEKELESTEILLFSEVKDLKSSLSLKTSRKNELDTTKTVQLIPKADSIKSDLEKFRLYSELTSEKRILIALKDEWRNESIEFDSENIDKGKYKPKSLFPTSFCRDLNQYFYDILKICQYPSLQDSSFSMDKFDFDINGDPKDSHGKGYRAFINTVSELSFRKLFFEKAKHDPGFLIIDTPDLGLDEGSDDKKGSSKMLSLLFSYLSNENMGQIIFVENTNVYNDVDTSEEKINYIIFDKKGLLNI